MQYRGRISARVQLVGSHDCHPIVSVAHGGVLTGCGVHPAPSLMCLRVPPPTVVCVHGKRIKCRVCSHACERHQECCFKATRSQCVFDSVPRSSPHSSWSGCVDPAVQPCSAVATPHVYGMPWFPQVGVGVWACVRVVVRQARIIRASTRIERTRTKLA